MLYVLKFEWILAKFGGFQVAIYTVLHAESESEVKQIQIWGPGAKIHEIRILEKFPLIFFNLNFFNLTVGLISLMLQTIPHKDPEIKGGSQWPWGGSPLYPPPPFDDESELQGKT